MASKLTEKAASPLPEGNDVAAAWTELTDYFTSITDWFVVHWVEVLIALAVAVVLYVALSALKRLGARYVRRNDNLTGYRMIIGRAIAKTTRSFRFLIAAQLVVSYASAPDWLESFIGFLFTITVVLQIAIWVRELLIGFIEKRNHSTEDSHETLDSAMKLIHIFVTFVIFAIAVVVILGNLGVDVTGLIAGLGVGGIAIGLAAQGIFADLFAAIAIIFDKPFSKGDTIQFDSFSGSVEEIGLKSTRIRAVTGEEIIISNANLLNKEIQNLTRRPHRRTKFAITLIYQTPADKADKVPDILQDIVESAGATFVRAGFVGFGDSSINYEVEFDGPSDFTASYHQRHRVGIAIFDRFAKEGLEFAYPTQTTFTSAPDGTMVMPYPQIQPVRQIEDGTDV